MSTPTKRQIQAEDLYRYQRVFDPKISPDGSNIVLCVEHVDQKTEKKHVNLWLVAVENKSVRQFTFGNYSDTRPAWSPDGRQIAFLSNRGDEKQPQIYLIPIDGGEARPLTQMKGSFGSFEWSPNGQNFVCQFRRKDQEVIEREEDPQKKELGVVARHITRPRFKFDEQGYLPQSRWHIWTIDTSNGTAVQLTSDDSYDEQEPHWSPDGSEILFFSNRSANPDIDDHLVDLYAIPAIGGDLRHIETPDGEKSHASWSGNGRFIAYLAHQGKGDAGQNTNLWLVPSDGSAPAQNLTGHFDIEFSSNLVTDTGDQPTTRPVWASDDQSLFVHTAQHGTISLNRLSRDGESLEELVSGSIVGAFSLDRAQNRAAYWHGTLDDLGQIHVLDLAANQSRCLTRFNDWLDEIDLGEIEELWFKGAAGNDLQGWILKPPGFDPAQKYPSILEIHGGPWTQYGRSFFHEFYLLAANGYVVYFTNPRGGQGYGEAHAKAIHRRWGQADYADLMAWTDYVASLPYIDTERMGVTGGSYGGYMTGWIVGQTTRFKAAVAQRMVSNGISFWGSSDVGYFFEDDFGNGKPPWENLTSYWDQSPMKYVANVKTPTLVIHSEQDFRCRQEQGEQFFLALKRLGVDSELVLFPEEPHGLSRNGRTDRRIVRLNHILRWFNKYL
ncbi:MAG: S9 family peptidase [Ardenticatenaceae bacterium]|nr:S9 family peptidase [Ardenticatenaceae bacterium]MCB9444586.1 S9 family peptidase [Ardenticatenaceae bacterium]